ncbi:MAG: anaerobic C4-dicarboxylate transporter [Flavobacteriales bacterium]|nr:anaerobic C4-dicarboxylate transporter [Flavobacteriales bacterium]
MLWLELAVVLACIVVGSRLSGIGMGVMGGIGLVVLVFLFGLPPGGPPGVVLGMIIAVITALSSMEAAGGLNYLVSVAEKILRKNPKSITFIAPLVTYVLIFLSGTQHVIYALLPVISEIARKSGIRPERPLSITVIASMHGLIASPISAVTVAMLAQLSGRSVSLPQIMMVTIPATLIAVLIGALSVAKRGKELKDEPPLSQADNEVEKAKAPVALEGDALRNAKGATFLFFGSVVLVVLIGLFPAIRPHYTMSVDGVIVDKEVDMAQAIMIIMLAIAGLIMLLFKASAAKAVGGPTMKSGIVAVISILGISWLGSSFFEGNKSEIVDGFSAVITGQEWLFGVGLFALSMLLFSQAATIVTLMPVALALDMPTPLLIALYPAVNGIFFLPTYGTMLAAVSFDRTGTTRIGKFVVNHSFMLPGLVTTISAVLLAFAFSYLLL